jgi:hypothetical protein
MYRESITANFHVGKKVGEAIFAGPAFADRNSPSAPIFEIRQVGIRYPLTQIHPAYKLFTSPVATSMSVFRACL